MRGAEELASRAIIINMTPPKTLASSQHVGLDDEFKRLCARGREHLVLSELTQFRPNGGVLPVDVSHLGVLWVLNRNRDGKVTLEDLHALADLCRRRSRSYLPYEVAAQLQGFCSLKLWQAMCEPDGQEQFVNWVCALLVETSPERRRFWRYGAQQYLHVDTLEVLHHLLRVQELCGLDFQSFFDLLQRVGEERGAMDLQDAEQDHWAPLGVVKEFVAGAYRGAYRLLADVCPLEQLPRDMDMV